MIIGLNLVSVMVQLLDKAVNKLVMSCVLQV